MLGGSFVDVVAGLSEGMGELGGLGLDQRLHPGADQLGEHRPHVSGLQGVELGKQLAGVILKELKAGQVGTAHDGSTTALLEYFVKHRD